MNNKNSINGNGAKERDPDLIAAEVAMKRAAFKARMRAKEVGTCVVIWKNGHIVEDSEDGKIAK
jgi:hypothetical protein